MISIVIPIHDMQGGADFLWRSINALTAQTFTDWELIITKDGKMAENTNSGIKRAHGELIKILYLDDYLSHPNALKDMVEVIGDADWLICGTDNNPNPYWTDDIETGNNKLGSPSALMIRNDNPLLFDETLSWLLDCDYYKLMNERCGKPVILNGNYVTLGIGEHQMSHILTDAEKVSEAQYLKGKYE